MKTIRLPHTLVLIYLMVALTAVATWVIPGGAYDRVVQDGRSVPVPGSFTLVPRRPQGLAAFFVAPVRGFVDAAPIIAIVFVVGGAFAVIQKTGAISAVIQAIAWRFGRSRALRALLIPVTMIVFSLAGGVWGMCEETMPFVLIFVPLAVSLGYDSLTGVAIPFVGAAAGFAGAFFNPFTVGIAQGIAGLPLYSGLGYRLFVWAAGTAIAIAFVMRHASRVLKDPRRSPTFEEDQERRKALLGAGAGAGGGAEIAPARLTGPQRLVLLVFAAGFGVMVFGILKYHWFINEIAGIFLAMGIFSGIAGRLRGDEIGRSFVEGAKDMINAALIIGTARAILIVATDGRVLDTLLYACAGAVSRVHPAISAQFMFIAQSVINFFVHSGTAQAALTIPVMAPLGDLVGITRQTTVLAFQFAEYINPVLPTSGVTMGVLGLAALRWEKWARWLVPLLVAWVIFALLCLVPPVLLNWS